MGKKNKKRSNKKGGGGNKPQLTSPRSVDADVAAAAAASASERINPPTPLSSPDKAVAAAAAAADLPVAAATATAELPVVSNEEEEEEVAAVVAANAAEEAFKETFSGGSYTGDAAVDVVSSPPDDDEGGDTLKVVDEIVMIPKDDDDDDENDAAQSTSTVKDNAAAAVVDEETVVKEDTESAVSATASSKEKSIDEKPAAAAAEVLPVVVVGDAMNNDKEDDDDAVVVVAAPKEEEEVAAEAETTSRTMVDAALTAETAQAPTVSDMVVEVKEEEAVGLEETVPTAVVKEAETEAASLVDTEHALSSFKEKAMDAAAPAVAKKEELNVVTVVTTNASSSNDAILLSSPTPAPRAMIETPSPSRVAELKNKLWDSKGLQVRIRPSVTADSIRKQQAPLAPVPSPFRPNAATGVNAETAAAAVAATTTAAATATAPNDKDITSAPTTAGQSPKVAASPAPLSSNETASPATSTSATGLSANNNGRRLARRKGPTAPKSILDEKALLAALQERGVAIKDIHISAFYQALHRQQYPDLSTFVENFYKHENNKNQQELLPTLTGPSAQTAVSQFNKKNRNKMQLPKAFLEFLSDPQNGFVTMTSKIAEAQTSLDKSTTKLRIELHDGKMVESVLMRYNKNSKENHRASLCISSQCGCAMGCTFCATGMMGLSGNLTTAEILEQIIHADGILAREWSEKQQQQQQGKQPQVQEQQQQSSDPRTKKHIQKKPTLDAVRNVVFMGMGEPLDNYTNVVEACRALMDRKRFNLAQGRVTVSTVGLVSQMRKISQDLPHVNLALSLHAPNQEMREKIVPSAKRYPIEELVDALDGHMKAYMNSPERLLHVNRQKLGVKNEVDDEDGDDDDMSQDDDAPDNTNGGSACNSKESGNTRRRAMIEYIMLEGETCTETSAHELGKLCQGKSFVVNLIPYNATNVKDPLKCPTYDEMQKFRAIVASYGVFCTVRRTMGSDIDSACGQLITLQQQQQQQQQHDQGAAASSSVRDIEDSSRSCQPRSPKAGNDAATSISQKTTTTRANASNKDDSNNNKDDLDKYIGPLAIAAGVVATCFLASLFLRPRRR